MFASLLLLFLKVAVVFSAGEVLAATAEVLSYAWVLAADGVLVAAEFLSDAGVLVAAGVITALW